MPENSIIRTKDSMALTPQQYDAVQQAQKALALFAAQNVNGRLIFDYKDGVPVVIEEFRRTPIKTK